MRSVIILAAVVMFHSIPVSAQDQVKQVVSGLAGPVTVSRDARGIPYIEAANDADLYFAQGYVTASDRLWQMDLMRRLARGETAEIFGTSVLEEDKRWRRFGFAQIADQSIADLSPQLRQALDNYARGVNAYIATLDDKTLPVEFRMLQYRPRPWTPSDTIVIGKILDDALSSTWRTDLVRASLKNLSADKRADLTSFSTPFDVVLFGTDANGTRRASTASHSPVPSDHALAAAAEDAEVRARSLTRVGLYAEDLAASNNWVISGKRTADGKPILENDPHLQATAPGVWHLVELRSPGVHAAGVTFPGVPGVVLGHNDDIAWGATNVGPDVQDLYSETFNANGEYKTPTGWAKPTVRHEQIKVRPNPLKPDTNIVGLDVIETGDGVVIADEGGTKYALKWTARDPKNNEFEFFFGADRAKDWSDFKTALKTYGGAAQNFVYADTKGNIGWYAAGRIPIRRKGDGSVPYDGSTTDGDWVGYIPFAELPNLYNPPGGLIVTANQRTVSLDYKYPQFTREVAYPWRARRIHDALSAKKAITADDVRDVQYDVFNIPYDAMAKKIVETSAASAETLAALRDWDGQMVPDSRAALLVNEIRGCVANKMTVANAPVPAYILREKIVDMAVRDDLKRWLPAGFESYTDLLKTCDRETRSRLADPKVLGPDPSAWTWGRVFKSRFPHPLGDIPLIGAQFATPSIPIKGSGQTPNVGSNVSMRMIATPGNWDATRHVIPLGESGDPRSPHYKDEFDTYISGKPAIFPFSRQAVAAAAVETLTLTPR